VPVMEQVTGDARSFALHARAHIGMPP
jgi:hypothetical protein